MKTVLIPNEVLVPEIKRLIDDGHTITFRVRGLSMRIFLEGSRDKIILGPCNSVRIGDVVLAETVMGYYVLHRVIRIEGNLLTLQGDGNIRDVENCIMDNVVGVALGFYRKGRDVPDMVTGIKWRFYSEIWITLTPVRRYLLAFYERIWLKLFPCGK